MGLSLALDQFDVTLAPDAEPALLSTRWDESEATRWSLRALDPGLAMLEQWRSRLTTGNSTAGSLLCDKLQFVDLSITTASRATVRQLKEPLIR